MKELIILVGNIGSGKSTLAKRYVKKGYIVVSRDSFRYGIGGGKYIFNLKYEPIIWKIEKYTFQKFIDLGINVLVDEVGINEKLRHRYIPYAKSAGYKIVAIELPRLTMKESVDRRMIDPHGQYNRKLWEQVWSKFDMMYESPSKKEGIDKIKRIK